MPKNILLSHNFILILAVILLAGAPVLLTTKVGAISNATIASSTNSIRTSSGLTAYTYNNALGSAAQSKAQHMCTLGYWAHTAPDGTTGWHFMNNAGYNYEIAGENLAKGFSSDQAVVQGWMNSPGHRANILHNTFREIGVGHVACGDEVIVVAMYGTRANSKPPAPVQQKSVVAASPTVSVKPSLSLTSIQNVAGSNKSVESSEVEKLHPALEFLLKIFREQDTNNFGFQYIVHLLNGLPLV